MNKKEIEETKEMEQERLMMASLDRIWRGEGLAYSNAKRFSKENYWQGHEEVEDPNG